MANTLSKTGITTGNSVETWHVTQSIDALTGTEAYDITISGSLSTIGTTSGSFIGNGSGLTGVTVEWDGSHNGNASITGSLTVTGNVSSSLDILGRRYSSNGNVFAISDSGTTTLGDIEKTKISGTNITLDAPVTASSDVSASGNVYASSGTIPTLISPLEITGNSGLTVEGTINMTATEYTFLPPRITTAQKNAIINIAGSVVFDTDLAKLCINNGSAWETITSA